MKDGKHKMPKAKNEEENESTSDEIWKEKIILGKTLEDKVEIK